MNQCGFCGEYTEALTRILIWAEDGDGYDDEADICVDCLEDIHHDQDFQFTYASEEDML